MKKVLLHDQRYSIGGPKAALDGIVNSYLKEKYQFVRLFQTESCGFNPIKAVKFVNKYRQIIDKENADVIYICGLQYVGFLMTLAARLSNVRKIVLSVHGSEWDFSDYSVRKLVLMYLFEPLEIRMADSVITVCNAAQKRIRPLRKSKNNDGVVYNAFPDLNYEIIESGLLRKELGIDSNIIVVTSVGRVVEDKGHRYIIDAIKRVKGNGFVFVIVGDGPYLNTYEQECRTELEEGTIFLLGRRSDVPQILKDTDIFLFPTLHENHSIALLEAVNMHCASICTQVGGNPEIIEDGVSGILIPTHSSESIVRSLEIMKDSNLRHRYANKAYIDCKAKFSDENTYGKLDRIFDNSL